MLTFTLLQKITDPTSVFADGSLGRTYEKMYPNEHIVHQCFDLSSS
jgi:hypothetical protein